MPGRKREVFFTEDGTRYLITLHDWDQVTRDTVDCEFGVYVDAAGDDESDYVGGFEGSAHPDRFSDTRLIELALIELAASF